MTIEVTSNEKEAAPKVEETKPVDMAALAQTEEPSEEIEAKPGEEVAAEAVQESSEADIEETEESGELEAKDDEKEEEKPKKKSKGGFQRRVDKLTAKAQALEEEKEFWRQEALKTREASPKKEESSKPDFAKRPKAEDFETNDAYMEALSDWKVEQKLSALEQKRKEDSIKNEVQTKVSKHRERVAIFEEAHDDFQDVMQNVANIPLSLTVQEAILDSELGPEVMYELAKTPKEFRRICSLGPVAAAKEIGKIEARLSKNSEDSPVETKTTKAPKPVVPVRNRGTTVIKDIYDPNIDQREFNRIRNEQERARAR